MSFDILFRRETLDDMQVGANAAHFDDVDTFVDPATGMTGLVAVHQGRRVCQQCGKGFNAGDPRLRMTPVYLAPDAPPVGLHAKCEVPPSRIFTMFKGLQVRRNVARVVKASRGLDNATAKADTDKSVIIRGGD